MVKNKEQKIDRLSSFMFPVQSRVVGGPTTNTIRETAKILLVKKKPRKSREEERKKHISRKKE